MELHEIVQRLVGEIKPIGESRYDAQCFENMGKITKLLDDIIDDLIDLVEFKNCIEHSKQIAGIEADYVLTKIRTKILEYI